MGTYVKGIIFEISRRLKAARWLAGGVNEKGQPTQLPTRELAEREQLVRNGITANALAEIEQLVRDARPMELREIADALEVPQTWFTAPTATAGVRLSPGELSATVDLLAPLLLQAADQATGGATGSGAPASDESDRPEASAGDHR